MNISSLIDSAPNNNMSKAFHRYSKPYCCSEPAERDLGLTYAVSVGRNNNMSFALAGGKKDVVQKNRGDFLEKLDIPCSSVVTAEFGVAENNGIVQVNQSHGGQGVFYPENSVTAGCIWTADGMFLMGLSYDCLVMGLFDKENGLTGLLHAGYREVEHSFIPKAFETLREAGWNIEQTHVVVSPYLYELVFRGDKKSKEFLKFQNNPFWKPYCLEKGDEAFVDWTKPAFDQLLWAGIPEGHIDKSIAEDTRFNYNYFCRRRQEELKNPPGAQATIIGRKV